MRITHRLLVVCGLQSLRGLATDTPGPRLVTIGLRLQF
jgi:hypothetical protein